MSKHDTPVDFTDTQSVNEALAAQAETELGATPDTKKAKKPAGPKIVKVSFVADRDIAAGETVEFNYELPKSSARGAVSNIPLTEMNDDQLKIEYRNANSVYYKQNKLGKLNPKSAERLEAVKVEMANRGIQPTARTATKVDASTVAELIKKGEITVEDIQALLDSANA